MGIEIKTDVPPLRQEPSGAVRVGDSRVLLELVIRAFQDGATPETIVQRYPSTTLSDIYAVVTYYLRHPEIVDRYLAEREAEAEAVRHKIEARQGSLADIRERLLAQRRD